MRRLLVVSAVLCSLVACSGSTPSLNQTGTALPASGSLGSVVPAAAGKSVASAVTGNARGGRNRPVPVAGTNVLRSAGIVHKATDWGHWPTRGASSIIVADDAADAIFTFPATADGNVAPSNTLTSVPNLFNIYNSHRGGLWVSGGFQTTTAYEYPIDASGNASSVTPLDTIDGALAGMTYMGAVAEDGAGQIFIDDYNNNAIYKYDKGATASSLPSTVIAGSQTQLNSPQGTFARHGALYVANSAWPVPFNNDPPVPGSVLVFQRGQSGNVAPAVTIAGSQTGLVTPFAVWLDCFDDIWVADLGANAIFEYAPWAHGNAAPFRTITGTNTGLQHPVAVAVDDFGFIYVVNQGVGPGRLVNYGTGFVSVFGPNAKGDAAPLQTIQGSATGLLNPSSIAIRQHSWWNDGDHDGDHHR